MFVVLYILNGIWLKVYCFCDILQPMKEFRGARRAKMMKYSWWVALILCCVAAFLLVSVIKIYGSYRFAKKHQKERQEELAKLNENMAGLKTDVNLLQTSEGLEEVLREKYRAVKPGENLIILLDDKK